jgi:hypothetical protein
MCFSVSSSTKNVHHLLHYRLNQKNTAASQTYDTPVPFLAAFQESLLRRVSKPRSVNCVLTFGQVTGLRDLLSLA